MIQIVSEEDMSTTIISTYNANHNKENLDIQSGNIKATYTYLIACSLCALRISGFILRLAKISVRDAPTIARWNF